MRHLYVHGRTHFSTDTALNAVQHRHSPQRCAAQTQPSTHCTLHRALRCQNSRATARSQQGQQELKAVCACTCFGAVQGNEALSGAGSYVSDTHTHTHTYIHTFVIRILSFTHLRYSRSRSLSPPLPPGTCTPTTPIHDSMLRNQEISSDVRVRVCVCVCVLSCSLSASLAWQASSTPPM